MNLVVLRHGQTAWNREGRMQGQLDIPLDAVGREQAAAAARELAVEEITSVLSSDLLRARATAATIAQARCLPMTVDARLREQHYGDWQGLTYEEISMKPPHVGGESLSEVGERALSAVVEHLREEGTLLVVTHGDTARALLGRLLSLPPEGWDPLPALGNARWVRLTFDRGTWNMSRQTSRAGESIPA